MLQGEVEALKIVVDQVLPKLVTAELSRLNESKYKKFLGGLADLALPAVSQWLDKVVGSIPVDGAVAAPAAVEAPVQAQG